MNATTGGFKFGHKGIFLTLRVHHNFRYLQPTPKFLHHVSRGPQVLGLPHSLAQADLDQKPDEIAFRPGFGGLRKGI